ncbi:protein bcp1 [Pseudohyphozyma bogoriensis]|nr:protein bcp1 [Pseudohyphozyma bogoriensis]
MSKRQNDSDSDNENNDGDVEMLDVSFDFFDPQAHDYHSIKLLLSQLLSHDAASLDLGGVADLVLEQKLVGSTVKTDGNEGDPYAVLTVLNLNVHKDKAPISALINYILSKLPSTSAFHSKLTTLLSHPSSSTSSDIGIVLSERLVNMPPQVVPPMYRMLEEELKWAIEDKEPYNFSHLLFISRVFLASQEELEDDPNAALNSVDGEGKKKKKTKKPKTAAGAGVKEEVWMYHPEDEFIARSAEETHTFAYSAAPPKNADGDSFGVQTKGQVMLVPWSAFPTVVEGMESFLGSMTA